MTAAAKAESTTRTTASERTPAYSWIVLAVLCFVYIFNFLDRQLMSILTEQIKADLHLTDTQIGLMTGFLFALFYTVIGVLAGWLADRTNRVRILAAGCFLWSLFTVMCGLSRTFPMMAVARMGVGVGEAAGAPPSYSIVSDYFPAHRRGMALALFSLGVPFGMALGAGFGAKIADIWSWRHAFVGIGLAGIVASGLLLLVVREPKRGAQDVKLDVHMEEAPSLHLERSDFKTTVQQFFGRPALFWTAVSCGMAAFVGYAVLNWTSPFLQREKGINMSEIALYYSLMLAISMGLGTWLAGALVDKLAAKARKYYALVPAAALLVAMPFFLGFVWAPSWQGSMAFLAVPTFLNIFYLAPALAVVQNAVKPSQRTMSGALLLLVLNLVGLGGGPTFIGIVSDTFAPTLGVHSLQRAFYFLTPFYVLAVAAHLVEAWALQKEQANGVPNDAAIKRNVTIVKLVVGFGGLALFLFLRPMSKMTDALTNAFQGASYDLNNLIRVFMVLVMAAIALMGVMDVLKGKPRES